MRGVRLRDPVSLKSFTATIPEVFKRAQSDEKGIDREGEKLSDERFVDDLALTTEDKEQ